MEAAVWGLVGTIVGALASMGTAWLTTRNSQRLQSEKAREDRIERANAFQRQTLLDLQDAIHDALRLVHLAHMEDLEAHRAGKEWGKNYLSEELNEGVRLAMRKVAILIERVSDDGLRSDVKSLMGAATHVLLARSENAAQVNLDRIGDVSQVNEKIGTVLRRHY